MDTMTKAAADVLAERKRQIAAEGWTPEHDDEHSDCSMAAAAASYALQHVDRSWLLDDYVDGDAHYQGDEVPDTWPDSWSPTWWKPKSPRADLVRAAALLLAEIERLDRAA